MQHKTGCAARGRSGSASKQSSSSDQRRPTNTYRHDERQRRRCDMRRAAQAAVRTRRRRARAGRWRGDQHGVLRSLVAEQSGLARALRDSGKRQQDDNTAIKRCVRVCGQPAKLFACAAVQQNKCSEELWGPKLRIFSSTRRHFAHAVNGT